MHPIFVVRGFMSELDSLNYKIDVCTDWDGVESL